LASPSRARSTPSRRLDHVVVGGVAVEEAAFDRRWLAHELAHGA
jgi:hypothetical protein